MDWETILLSQRGFLQQVLSQWYQVHKRPLLEGSRPFLIVQVSVAWPWLHQKNQPNRIQRPCGTTPDPFPDPALTPGLYRSSAAAGHALEPPSSVLEFRRRTRVWPQCRPVLRQLLFPPLFLFLLLWQPSQVAWGQSAGSIGLRSVINSQKKPAVEMPISNKIFQTVYVLREGLRWFFFFSRCPEIGILIHKYSLIQIVWLKSVHLSFLGLFNIFSGSIQETPILHWKKGWISLVQIDSKFGSGYHLWIFFPEL